MTTSPQTQYAVQLVGPDELVLNKSREVFSPGRHQVLCKVEAVGLCFSDLKLLKQFSSHVRKSEIVSGIDPEALKEIPSYVPSQKPAVPGHEAVIRIQAVGPDVRNFKPGRRYLVQTDYRWLRTASSNAAFGYNFEGALQEYVLMDERIITSPEGESMLIPVGENLSASAIALVEPWACVEDAYASKERTKLKKDGRMLIVADTKPAEGLFQNLFRRCGRPAQITWVSSYKPPEELANGTRSFASVSELADYSFDDVIYFGSEPDTVEQLFAKIAAQGLLNIVFCGGRFGRDIVTPAGRVHYGGIRIIGCKDFDPAESMQAIPDSDEIRAGDKINVVGAAGPMGTMHVIRNICRGIKGVSVFAGDIDDGRLAGLTKIAEPLAKKNDVVYRTYNPTQITTGRMPVVQQEGMAEKFDYIVLMAPVFDLVAASVHSCRQQGIINIFAGIPATVTGEIDLDTYIEKQLYFVGTSGSTLDDMKQVLTQVKTGRLDTNVSVAAVCGLDGAIEGIRAVEKRSIAGKIIVYPHCKGLGLVRLEELEEKIPEAAAHLDKGLWTKQAEQKLLEKYS